jgi:hypothetical protein
MLESWMSRVPDNKKLVLMNIPATHDSTAYYMNRISLNLAKTQIYTIKEQLEIGTRKFDLRITKKNKIVENDDDIICCHGICDCYASNDFLNMTKLTFKSVIIDVKNFLLKNPTEAVLLGTSVEREGNDNTILKKAFEIFNNLLDGMIVEFKYDLTLGKSRGKVVNYTHYHEEVDKSDLKRVISRSYNLIPGTGISQIHKKYGEYSTYKVNGNLKIQELKDMFEKYNMTLEEAEKIEQKNKKLFPLDYSISCTGEKDFCLPNPLMQANIVHSFIQRDGVLKKGYYYGWLKMDFANVHSNYKLIEANFVN